MGDWDSDSASLGSNPSPPAKESRAVLRFETTRQIGQLGTNGVSMPHKNRHTPRLTKLRGGFAVSYWEGDKRRRFSLATSDLQKAKELFADWRPPDELRRSPKASCGIIYFIQSGCPNRFIKIGLAINLQNRLSTLQISTPYELTVLASIKGGERDEAELHRRFANAHVRGEWFRPTVDLMAFIEALTPATLPPIDWGDDFKKAWDRFAAEHPEDYARAYISIVPPSLVPAEDLPAYHLLKEKLGV